MSWEIMVKKTTTGGQGVQQGVHHSNSNNTKDNCRKRYPWGFHAQNNQTTPHSRGDAAGHRYVLGEYGQESESTPSASGHTTFKDDSILISEHEEDSYSKDDDREELMNMCVWGS